MPSPEPISDEKVLRFDGLMIDRENFSVFINGNPVSLTPRAFDVLVFLAERRDRVVEKQELFSEIWKDTFVTDNALTKVIKEIRQAVGDEVASPRFIETVPKRGYRFIAESIREEPGIPAPPPKTEISRPEPRARGRSHPLLLIGIGVMAVAVVAAGYRLMSKKTDHGPFLTSLKQLTNGSGLDDFPTFAPDGNAIAYCSNAKGNFDLYVRQLTPGARERQLTNDGGQNLHPAWSPDGQRIAFTSKIRGGIWVIPANGGEARQLSEFGSRPAWSPDSRTIVFQSNPSSDLGGAARNALSPSTLWVVDAEGGEPKPLTKVGVPAGGHGSPAWSPNGRRIAFEVDDFHSSHVWTIAADGTDPKPVCPNPAAEPSFTPDGKSICVSSWGIRLVSIDPETGTPAGDPVLLTGSFSLPSFVRRVVFSRDGKKMAISSLTSRNNISSIRIKGATGEPDGEPTVLLANANLRNNFPAFSPDGGKIAFSSCALGGSACDLWMMNNDGTNPTQITTDEGNEMNPSWSTDGRNLSFLSNQTGKWSAWTVDIVTKRERKLFDSPENIEYGKVSPDGKTFLFQIKKDGILNVWKASLPEGTVQQLTFDREFMGFPVLSPDGTSVAVQARRGDDTIAFLLPVTGGKPEQLTSAKGQTWIFDWSPDGDKLLFAGFRDSIWNVWWISRTTKKEVQLTHFTKSNAFVRYPAWSPKGNQIVFEFSETLGNILVADLQ